MEIHDGAHPPDRKASSDELVGALEGAPFPASRVELERYARGHDAPESVVKAILELPKDRFVSLSDLAATYGPGERA